MILNFVLGFAKKYFTTIVIEKIIIVMVKEAVKRTDSKVDDEIYEAIFGKIEK